MAIELGKVNVTDLVENDYKVLGIGINQSSNNNGIFSTNYTTLTQAKNNLKLLLSIIKQALMFRSYFILILSFCLTAMICAGQSNQYFKKIDNIAIQTRINLFVTLEFDALRASLC